MPLFHPSKAGNLDELNLAPAAVCDLLAPYLSEERKRRIERSVASRLVSITVVLEEPYDPHNAAAVLRTCEALGLLHVHIVRGEQGWRVSSKVSIGADKWLNIYLHETIETCFVWLKQRGFSLWGALPPAFDGQQEMTPSGELRPIAVVFGNEHRGLSSQARALCDHALHLPMWGFSESLNLSVSVAVALSELTRHHRQHLGRSGDLDQKAITRLRAAYYARSSHHAIPLIMQHLTNESSSP